jgi:hypothetical protein
VQEGEEESVVLNTSELLPELLSITKVLCGRCYVECYPSCYLEVVMSSVMLVVIDHKSVISGLLPRL